MSETTADLTIVPKLSETPEPTVEPATIVNPTATNELMTEPPWEDGQRSSSSDRDLGFDLWQRDFGRNGLKLNQFETAVAM